MDSPESPLEALARCNPDALQLAVYTSLALRIEPALLRALRQALLPHADPSAELDLWFSQLVRARSLQAVQFDEGLQQGLRDRLSAEPARRRVLALTRAHLAQAHWMARAELELNALPVMDPDVPDADIEAQLAPLLDQLRGGGAPALQAARWLLQAAPAWHSRVRRTAAAWAALQAASALLGGRRLLDDVVPAGGDPRWLLSMRGTPAPLHDIGVVMSPRRLEFVAAGSRGAAPVQVPRDWPSLVLLQPEGQPVQVVSALPGQSVELPGVDAVTLRNLDGSGWRVRPARRRRASPTQGPITGRIQAHLRGAQLVLSVELTAAPKAQARKVMLHAPLSWQVDDAIPGLVRATPEAVWQEVAPAEDFWNALRPLRTAQAIELAVEPSLAWLPWEGLELPGSEPWAERAIGLRLLRTLPPLRKGPALAQGGALVIADWAGTEDMPSQVREEGSRVEDLLRGGSSLKVERVDPRSAKELVAAVHRQPWAVLHWSSRALVAMPPASLGDEPALAIPIDKNTYFGPADFSQLQAPPELVVLNLDDAGYGAEHERHLRGLSLRQGAHPLDVLLAMGVPMLAACAGRPPIPVSVEFTMRLHQGLLAGQTLIEATREARLAARARDPKGWSWSQFQVFGKPHRKASYALLPTAAKPPQRIAARSLVRLVDTAAAHHAIMGFEVGPGLVLSARAGIGQLERMVVQGGATADVYDFDPAEAALQVAVGLRAEDARASSSRLPLRLGAAPPSEDVQAEVWMLMDGQPTPLSVSGRYITQYALGKTRLDDAWVLTQGRPGEPLPRDLAGAPLVVDERCVGVMLEPLGDGSFWVAAGPETMQDALARAQRRYVDRRLESHAGWLRSAGRSGRRLVADGADLGGYDLRDADLRQASLRAARLNGADLRGARLDKADLRDADLRNARLEDSSFEAARSDGARIDGARQATGTRGVSRRVPDTTGVWVISDGSPDALLAMDAVVPIAVRAGVRLYGAPDDTADRRSAQDRQLCQGAILLWRHGMQSRMPALVELDEMLASGRPVLPIRLDDSLPPGRLAELPALRMGRSLADLEGQLRPFLLSLRPGHSAA